MDWALKTDPQIEGSCLLGTDGQCVAKATSLLSALREQLASCKDLSGMPVKTPESMISSRGRAVSTFSEFSSPRSTAKTNASEQLVIKGSRTGQKKVVNINDTRNSVSTPSSAGSGKFDWPKADHVIAKSLSLVMKLEKDRCETMKQLETEKEKVKEMRRKLDEKATERLKLLANIVQNEHEQCLQDMLEMKWHVGYEGRHLKQIQDDVRVIIDRNLELKTNLEGINKQFALLEEKIEKQSNTMAEITHKQLETNKKLGDKQKDYSLAKQKAHQTRERTAAEMKQMDRMLYGLKRRLESLQKEYEETLVEQEKLLASISAAKERTEEFERENEQKTEELEKTKETRNKTSDRVKSLKDNTCHLQKEIEYYVEENSRLSDLKKECLDKLDSESTLLQLELQQKTKDMRDGREKNESFLHNIEEMKEQIVINKKKTADAQKSMKSAERELTKVDRQLSVIHDQTELSRRHHRELVLQLRENEDTYDHEEYTLKSTVQSLKEELNKETKVRRIYQGKVAANNEDLEKMKAEHYKNYEQLKTQSEDAEKGEQLESHILQQVTDKFNEKKQIENELRERLSSLQTELSHLETELGNKIKQLIPQVATLSETSKEKGERMKVFKERESLLSDRIKDTKTSQSAIERMTNEILTGIEELKSQKEILDAKMAIEKEEEESWKKEFEEINNFSKESEEKFSTYKIERHEYLKELEANVDTKREENEQLSSDYECLRNKHVKCKGSVVRALERTSILEDGVRDKNQLLMLQRRLLETLKIHYEHRGSTGRKAVRKVKSTMDGTKSVVRGIETEMTGTLQDMKQFLQIIDSQQKDIRQLKQEQQQIERIKTTRTVKEPSQNKSVTFTLPVECPS